MSFSCVENEEQAVDDAVELTKKLRELGEGTPEAMLTALAVYAGELIVTMSAKYNTEPEVMFERMVKCLTINTAREVARKRNQN